MSLLQIQDLSVEFRLGTGTVHAVRGVDLHVDAGEILAVVGESGSGKSATALSVLRLNPEPPCAYPSGSVLLDGRDVLTMDERALRTIRGADVAMVFQDPMTSLDPLQRIGNQVAEVLRHHRGASRAEARAAVVPALREAGIPDPERRADQYPHELSGGLRQRAMIAMALVGRPRLLIVGIASGGLAVQRRRLLLPPECFRYPSGEERIGHLPTRPLRCLFHQRQ
jgi:ABC-type microcin C transport system duplicated ATPase subunit YejF